MKLSEDKPMVYQSAGGDLFLVSVTLQETVRVPIRAKDARSAAAIAKSTYAHAVDASAVKIPSRS